MGKYRSVLYCDRRAYSLCVCPPPPSPVITTESVYAFGNYGGGSLVIYDSSRQATLPPPLPAPTGFENSLLIKYDALGNAMWASYTTTTTGSNSTASATAITIDTLKNSYVAGYYTVGSLVIYNSSRQTTLSSLPAPTGSQSNSSLIKYDANGNALWATYTTTTTGSNSNAVATAITSDTLNNIYVAGTYSVGSLTIYNSSRQTTLPPPLPAPTGSQNSSLIKYDALGNALWATYTTQGYSDTRGITSDTLNNIYVAGIYFGGSLVIYNSSRQTTLSPSPLPAPTGSQNSLLIKYDALGNALWATYTKAEFDTSSANAITSDTLNNIYIAGYYTVGSLTIYNSSRQETLSPLPAPTGIQNSSLIKYDAIGNALWATYTKTEFSNSSANAITSDTLNNIYVVGRYNGGSLAIYDTTNRENPIGIFLPAPTGSQYNSSLIKYDANGNAMWAAYITGVGTTYSVTAFTSDTLNNIYIVGTYSGGSLAIYNSTGQATLSPLPAPTGARNTSLIKYNSIGIAQWATYTAR